MTTEIVIANRNAIAMAADSAVTVGQERVWKSAHKLFSLGPANDIGIMAHGAADYLGISWETIVKLFRSHISDHQFSTVSQCEESFFEFLFSQKFRNENAERISISFLFMERMEIIKKYLRYDNKKEFRTTIISLCKDLSAIARENRYIESNINIKLFKNEWSETIKALAKDIFSETITNAVCNSLCELMYHTMLSGLQSSYNTGIVFAGFGKDEIFPVINNYVVDGRHNEVKRYWNVRRRNMNDGKSLAHLIPLGQGDVIHSFMEGISERYTKFIENIFLGTLELRSKSIIDSYIKDKDEKTVEIARQSRINAIAVEQFMQEFQSYREEYSTDPVTLVLGSLPKEEMAAMAEALVEITSMRRRVDSAIESVGGPVDVAVISKGDGFIWIKRKHYFQPEINPSFSKRKFR